MNWYYALNGAQQGPVSEQQLMQLAASGTINATTLVWREGLPEWQQFSVALPAATGTAAADAPQIGGYAVPEGQKDIVVQQMREGVAPQFVGAMQYAGFWIRFAARFIDGLIMQVVSWIIMLPFGAVMQAVMPKPGVEPKPEDMIKMFAALAPIIAISMTVAIVYDVFMVVKYGGTLGKLAVGIKIVNDDGTKIRMGRAIGRFFAHIVSALTCYIGYIIAGFDSEKRALHDHMCSTRVIYKK
jgi:uncharacterized RDD family membrane protein YckC